jgi:Na+-translocating ferredoxin:NAD+ oxidoreductase subunit A
LTELFFVFIAACLANNLVLDYLIGLSPIFAVSRKIETAFGLSLAMLLITPLTSLLTFAVNFYILSPLNLQYLQLLVFVIIVSLTLFSVERLLKLSRPALHEQVSVFIPLLMVNTALIGAALLNIQANQGLPESLFFGIGSAIGFGIVLIILTSLRERIMVSDVPASFQGASILLITLGIISMAFMGFTGIS